MCGPREFTVFAGHGNVYILFTGHRNVYILFAGHRNVYILFAGHRNPYILFAGHRNVFILFAGHRNVYVLFAGHRNVYVLWLYRWHSVGGPYISVSGPHCYLSYPAVHPASSLYLSAHDRVWCTPEICITILTSEELLIYRAHERLINF